MSNNIFTTLLSVYLLITSIYLYKKTNQPKILMYIYLVMVLSAIILFIIYGLAYYFTGDGIDEATIYHLEYGLSGAGFLEYSWLIISTLIVFILGMLSLAIIILRQNNTKSAYTINPFWLLSFLGISLLLNPAVIDFYNIKKEFSGAISSKNLTNFNKSYRKPDIKESKKRHKNIVFIYAESLERTYFDNEMFPGLIKGLREIELKNLSFTNIKQVSGTGWTVAGITASQCGLPLFTASHGNSMSGMDNFLPSVICLGDILKEKGYQLNYMGGASLDFAGKGKLFKTHGFSNVLGRDELLPKIENKAYKTGWGLYDDSLFDMVYEHFSELSKTDKKFGIFMLTLDTHHPNGHPSKSCKGKEYKEGDNSILNAVSCSDYLISNFIKKISKSSYADKTLVVLVSDHLAMRNSAYDLLKKNDRRNLFMVIEPGKNSFSKVDTIGSTMDIGSTILPFLGYTGDIGLGRDLLNSENLEKDRFFIHSNIKK
ncbi:MAG TPA: phosphatidylglycerol--membrane-oligosaccharide glycerophosphotransferase, partial [Gammaproteobacteria bacterium]|nr:phosphatidylglycerol--membrane-oligosaccharide glycerophosphotransferase [Gammaproteobacteria bacterium]